MDNGSLCVLALCSQADKTGELRLSDCAIQLICDVRVATIRDTARQTLFRPFWMAGLTVARQRNDMMWLSQHGVVRTASRQVPNVCKQIMYSCPAVPTWPEEYSHISTKLCTNPVYLYKMCAQNASTCPAIPAVAAGQNNLSRQAVPQAHQGFCSSHVVPLLCRASRHVRQEWAVLYMWSSCSHDAIVLPQ